MSKNNVWKPFKKFEYQSLLPAELRDKVRGFLSRPVGICSGVHMLTCFILLGGDDR